MTFSHTDPPSFEPDETAPAEPSRGTILLAEDLPTNRELLREMLETIGFAVVEAADGAEAVAAFEAGRFDAVLMDCRMPGTDGYEATRRIRASEPAGSRVPILALTGGGAEADREYCLRAGMDDYLAKPFTMAKLEETLGRWVRRNG